MKIHLIGIGGTGMGALAGLLVEAGHEVRGSDGPLYPPMSTLLAALRVPLHEGYRAENLEWAPDRVVVGNVCKKDHPEAAAARERGMNVVSFPALLSELFLESRHAIVVAGTHGKTTTTSLAAHVLHTAGLNPGFLIGGLPRNFSQSFSLGQPPYFVVEGDEYDTAYFDKRPKFVHYRPQTVILTGVEFDHADIYPTMADVERAFALLVERVPPEGRILVCADSEPAVRLCRAAACPVETYSIRGEATWRGTVADRGDGTQEMGVRRGTEKVGFFRAHLTGRHNMENALSLIGLARGLGLEVETIATGLESFAGVRRRQEVRGCGGGVTIIDDFAHHPTAIRETLEGLRGVHGSGRLVAVFEPRSATSRRRVFQQEFVTALSAADHVVLGALHRPEGIAPEEQLDPERVVSDLRAAGVEAHRLECAEDIVRHLAACCRRGDTVVVMSSGSFGGLVERLLSALGDDR